MDNADIELAEALESNDKKLQSCFQHLQGFVFTPSVRDFENLSLFMVNLT